MSAVAINFDSLSEAQKKRAMKMLAEAEKEICPAGVRLQGKTLKKMVEAMQNEKDARQIYYRDEVGGDNRARPAHYAQCTRPCKKGEEMCAKHLASDKAVKLADIEGLREITSADDPSFKGKTESVPEGAIEIKILANSVVLQKLREALQAIGATLEEGTRPSDHVLGPAPSSEEEDGTARASDSVEDDEDEEGEELVKLTTTKGVPLGLDETTREVFSTNGDLLGKLVQVEHKGPPIKYEGAGWIVAVDFEHEDEEYIRCAISDNLYQLNDATYQKVGKVDKKGKVSLM